jgi:hypothetical protein
MPPVSNASLSAAGLVARKLVGAAALVAIVAAKDAICARRGSSIARRHSSTIWPSASPDAR